MIFKTIENNSNLSGLSISNSIKGIKTNETYSLNSVFQKQLSFDIKALEEYKRLWQTTNDKAFAQQNALSGVSSAARDYAMNMANAGVSTAIFEVNQKKAQVSLDAQNKTWKNCTKLINEYTKKSQRESSSAIDMLYNV